MTGCTADDEEWQGLAVGLNTDVKTADGVSGSDDKDLGVKGSGGTTTPVDDVPRRSRKRRRQT